MKILLLMATSLQLSAFAAEAPYKVKLLDAKNKPVGTATLTEQLNGLKVEVNVTKLPPGKHGMHFHQNGNCKAPGFESAGEHYNPANVQHGFNETGGPHSGDLPNLNVGKDGKAHVELFVQNLTLGTGPSPLFKVGGTSLVIHEKGDDYETQPSGNSGKRIACGVIQNPRTKQ